MIFEPRGGCTFCGLRSLVRRVMYDPGGQAMQSSADAAPVMLLYVPSGQAAGFDDPTPQ